MDSPDHRSGPPPVPAGRTFHFRCLRCGSVLEGRSSQCGQRGKCPTCDAVFTVPGIDPRSGLAVSHADPGNDGENPTPVHAYAAAGSRAPRIVRRDDDTLVIECPRCRRYSAVSANRCDACGLPFTLEGGEHDALTAQSGGGGGALALGLGVASLPLICAGVGFVPGLLAIVLGLYALHKTGREKAGLAWAGILLGTLACLLNLLVLP